MPSSSDYTSPKYDRGFPAIPQPTDFTPFVSSESGHSFPQRGREIDSSSVRSAPRGMMDYYLPYYPPQSYAPVWGYPYPEQDFSRPLVPPVVPVTSLDRISSPVGSMDPIYPRRFDAPIGGDAPLQSPVFSGRGGQTLVSTERESGHSFPQRELVGRTEGGRERTSSLRSHLPSPSFGVFTERGSTLPISPTWSGPDVSGGKRSGNDHELSAAFPDELPEPVGASGDRKGHDDLGAGRGMGDLYDPEIDGLPIPGIDGIDLKSAEPKGVSGRGDSARMDKKIEVHHDRVHMGINSPTAPLSPVPQLVESDVAPTSPIPQLVGATSHPDMQGLSDSLPAPSIDLGTSKDRTSFSLPHPSGPSPLQSSGSSHPSASLPSTFPSPENHPVEASSPSISSLPYTFPDGRGSDLPISSVSTKFPQPFPTLIGPPGEAHRIPSNKPISHRPMSPGIPFPSGPHMLPIGSPRALAHPYMSPFSPRFGVRPVGPTIKSVMSDPGIEIRSINPINFDKPVEISVFDGKQERKMWLIDDEQLKERQSAEEEDKEEAEALREEREEKQNADMHKIAENVVNEIVHEKLRMIIERMIHFTPSGGKGPWKKLLRGMTEELHSDDEEDEHEDDTEKQRSAKRAEEEKENDMIFQKRDMDLKAQEMVMSTMISRISKKEEELNAEVKRREAELDSRSKEVFYREGEISLRVGELDRREKKIQEDRVIRLEHEMNLQAKVTRLEEKLRLIKSESEESEEKKAEEKKEKIKKAEEMMKSMISGMSDSLGDAIRSKIPPFPERFDPPPREMNLSSIGLNEIWGDKSFSGIGVPHVQPGPYPYVPSSHLHWPEDEDDMEFPPVDHEGCIGNQERSGVTIEVVESSKSSFRLPDESSMEKKEDLQKSITEEQDEDDTGGDKENLISEQLVDMESLTSLVESV